MVYNRRDSGFVGVAELGIDIDQKPEINDTDDNAVVQSRRQSRMYSIDFAFLDSDGEQDRIVKKYKQVANPPF